jgi:hypothetical protein
MNVFGHSAGVSLRRRVHGLCALVFLVAGCAGGTGSSGLIGAEGILVSRVIETQTCEEGAGLTYCPTDVPEALATGEFISTPFDDETSLGCFKADGVGICAFVFSFAPEGFAESQGFALALREADSDDEWEVFDLSEGPTGDELDADLIVTTVVVDVAEPDGTELQLAILSFPGPPTDLPWTTPTLAELGADVVFLAPPLPAITELGSEDVAIEAAREGDLCEDYGLVAFCPTDVTLPEGVLEPALGPQPFPSQTRFDFETRSPILCVLEVGGSRCVAEIDFSVTGDIGTFFRVAARAPGDPEARWRLGEEIADDWEVDLEEKRSFTARATVELFGVETDGVLEVEIAVLVDPLDPLDLGRSIDFLNEAVPTYVFVPPVSRLEIIPAMR